MFIFTLVLSIALNLSVDWRQQVELYNQQNDSPETVWATTLLYHSSPESIQEEMLMLIDSEILRSGLKSNHTFKESLLIINESFNDETILLLNLLLESDPDVRDSLFIEHYYHNSETNLYSINKYARDGAAIKEDDMSIEQFGFHHFLVSFYRSVNRIADDKFYDHFTNFWMSRIGQQEMSDFNLQLLRATTIKSLYELNKFSQISLVYDPLDKFDYLPTSNLVRNFFWGLDFAFYRLDQLDISLDIQRNHTIPISEYLGDQNGLNSLRISNGAYLDRLGNYLAARDVFQSLMTDFESLSTPFQVSLYNNLSLVYFKTGEATKYVETQLKALELAREIDNFNQQSEIYRNLHIFYRQYQNWDLANQYINRATEIARSHGTTNDLVSILISKAVFEHLYLNNISAAHQMLDNAENLLGEEVDSRLQLRVMAERTVLLNSEKRWEESRQIRQDILELAAASSQTLVYIEALIELAFISHQLEEYNDVENKLKELRAYDTSILTFPKLVLAQTLRGKLHAVRGENIEANREFSQASELVFDRAVNTSEQETGYWNIEPEYLELFESYADFLIQTGKKEDSINLLDRVKTINDASLIDNPLIKASNLTEAELVKEKRLSEEMDQIRKQIFSSSGQNQLALQNRLASLSAQRRALLGSSSSNLDSGFLNIWALQNKLKGDQVLFHITDIDNNYYLSKIYKDDLIIEKIDKKNIDQSVFKDATTSVITGRTNLELLYEIGNLIDLNSIRSEISTIIFIPDGYFHQLPLAVIPINKPDSPHSYGSAHYFIEEMDVYTLNSLREFLSNRSTKRFEYGFTGFGVSDFNNDFTQRNLISLPKAPREVQTVLGGLNRFGNSLALTNQSATTQTFREVAGNSKILHLATHSEVSDSDPLFSRLHFYSDSADDSGQLFAYELFNLNLSNELVMLNSCESGGDRYLQGSGIMGINRALRYAGVQSLILNAWSVNDQFAADFAELFYKYLNQGETKSKSLQLAKIDFIKTKNANPHYWGSYILNGDNKPLLQSERNTGTTTILALLLIAGLVMFRKNSL